MASDGLASGDVVVLRVDLHNGSDTALQPGAFWVAFPPVEGATLLLQVTVLSSRNSLPELMSETRLLNSADETLGTLVDEEVLD